MVIVPCFPNRQLGGGQAILTPPLKAAASLPAVFSLQLSGWPFQNPQKARGGSLGGGGAEPCPQGQTPLKNAEEKNPLSLEEVTGDRLVSKIRQRSGFRLASH